MKILALSLVVLLCAAAPKPRVVAITAKKFSFAPDEIRLKLSEPVVFQLKAFDRTHVFKIADLKLRVDVTTGSVLELPFTPEKEGTFTFECDVFCGVHHEDMNGTLIVEK